MARARRGDVRDLAGDRPVGVLGDPRLLVVGPQPHRDPDRQLEPVGRLPVVRRERAVAVEALGDRLRERVGVGRGGAADVEHGESDRTRPPTHRAS